MTSRQEYRNWPSLSSNKSSHVEGRRRKKRKSNAHAETSEEPNDYPCDDSFPQDTISVPPSAPATPTKPFPELHDGWTNIEWTILEHTHDHIRGLGGPTPEETSPTRLAEAFIRIYETSELKKKAEEEGKEKKEFMVEEVRDRIIALRKIRDRRRSGDLPPARRLDGGSPKAGDSVKKVAEGKRRFSGILGRFW